MLTKETEPKWHLCCETIYRALYQGAKGGLSRTLTRKLRTGRPLRKKRRRADQRMPRFVAPAVLIDHRPPVIELRERLGDWERDLVVGVRSQSAVATLVDRCTRYLQLVPAARGTLGRPPTRCPDHRPQPAAGARPTESHLGPGLRDGPPSRTRALLRRRHLLRPPGQPVAAGTNENTNGLLRQYLPKRTNLSLYTVDDLRSIEHRRHVSAVSVASTAVIALLVSSGPMSR